MRLTAPVDECNRFWILVAVVVALIAGLLWWTRCRGNAGARDFDGRGAHDVGQDGPGRDNAPRGGNVAAR